MSHVILTPAYGRDYRSKDEVIEDLKADKDFMVVCGAPRVVPGNLTGLLGAGVASANIRFNKLRRVICVNLREIRD